MNEIAWQIPLSIDLLTKKGLGKCGKEDLLSGIYLRGGRTLVKPK